MTLSSTSTTMTATVTAVFKFGIKNGRVWPMPPSVVIRPHTKPRAQGWPRPVRLPSSDNASAKSHADARADAGGEADEKRLETAVGGKRGSEQRRQRRDRTIHQPGQSRLDDLQNEQPLGAGLFVLAQFRFRDLFGGDGVVAFLFRKVAEQLADASVGGAAGGGFVKAPGFNFHALGGFLDGLQTERPHQPDRFPVDKTAHVLPPDVRDMIAETGFYKVPTDGDDDRPLRGALSRNFTACSG